MSFLLRRPSSFANIGIPLHLNQYSATSSASMSTHAHLASSQRPRVPIEPEIVDDSEPERIEIRKSLKKRPRTPVESLQSPSIVIRDNFKRVNRISVIEISDSDSQSASSFSKYTRIQDIYARTQDQVQSTNSGDRTLYGPKSSSAGVLHTQLPIAIHNPSEEDEPFKGSSKLSLDRFMFKSSMTPRNVQASTEPAPSTSIAMPKNNAKGPKQKPFPLDLSASDVAKISRCICCNVQWTARKSGVQKMTHIQNCAKKHALDVGTVDLLIQKEISPEEPFAEKTFFEDVVVDAAPKQKVRRRKKEKSSLKSASISRDSILARAQGILSTSADDCKYQNGRGYIELPSTQAFGRSDLAQMQNFECNTFSLESRRPNILDDSSDQEESEAHLASLAPCLASHPLKLLGDSEHDHKGAQSGGHSLGDKSGVEITYSLNPKRHSLSLIEGRGIASSSVPRKPTPDSSPKLLSFFTNLTIHSPPPTLKSKKATKVLAKSLLDVSSHSDESTLSPGTVSSKKKKGSRKEISSKITHQFDEKWQLHLMHDIMLNTHLHMRILRYEPIQFEVFLDIAIRYAPPSGKLKQHLRTFLDGQAIIFYG